MRVFIDSEKKVVISDLKRLYALEETYFGRWFGAEYAYLTDEHHAESEELKQILLDLQEQIKHFGGKPKTGVY
jgi:hypothetical protein